MMDIIKGIMFVQLVMLVVILMDGKMLMVVNGMMEM